MSINVMVSRYITVNKSGIVPSLVPIQIVEGEKEKAKYSFFLAYAYPFYIEESNKVIS